MAVTNYDTIDGEIISEHTSGVQTDYMIDALGSVVGTMNQSAEVVNTYTYKPYGSQLAKTGAGPDPRFRWVGTAGYRTDSRSHSEFYVRARHYSVSSMWSSIDCFWPNVLPYSYAAARPTLLIDPTGCSIRYPGDGATQPCATQAFGGSSVRNCFNNLRNQLIIALSDPQKSQQIDDCVNTHVPQQYLPNFIANLDKALWAKDKTLCIFCASVTGSNNYPGLPKECQFLIDEGCAGLINSPFLGYTCPPAIADTSYPGCRDAFRRMGCDCITIFCEKGPVEHGKHPVTGAPLQNPVRDSACCNLVPLHETLHCISEFGHGPGHDYYTNPDWLDKVAFCICEVLFGKDKCSCVGVKY
jgi:hypothetical protein